MFLCSSDTYLHKLCTVLHLSDFVSNNKGFYFGVGGVYQLWSIIERLNLE